jgi:hypothetical protein
MPKIKLSKVAEEVLYQTIKQSKIPPGKGLRLEECDDGLTVTVSFPSEGDRTVKRGNNIILIVDKNIEKKVGEATIDVSHFKKGTKLVILRHEKDEKVDLEEWKGVSLLDL